MQSKFQEAAVSGPHGRGPLVPVPSWAQTHLPTISHHGGGAKKKVLWAPKTACQDDSHAALLMGNSARISQQHLKTACLEAWFWCLLESSCHDL